MRWLRRSLPPELRSVEAGFEAVLHVLEPAKARLTQVVPSTRVPGRPLQEASMEFAAALDEAARRMPAWRHPAVEERWLACEAGIREARDRASRLTGESGGFEALIWTVEQLLDPLEPFADAARRFDDLRVRRA